MVKHMHEWTLCLSFAISKMREIILPNSKFRTKIIFRIAKGLVAVEQWFSTRSDLPPRGHPGNVWRRFGLPPVGGKCSWLQVAQGRIATNHPTMHRAAPQQRMNWLQMAIVPKLRKPQIAGKHRSLELQSLDSSPSSSMEQLYNLRWVTTQFLSLVFPKLNEHIIYIIGIT